MEETIKQILQAIYQSSKIVVTTHANPDGDAIGSVLALKHYARNISKELYVILPGTIPENLLFLPGISDIINVDNVDYASIINEADTIIIVDLNDLGRLDGIAKLIGTSDAKKILIDHHPEPTINAEIILSDQKASATGILIWRIINCDNRFVINSDIAVCLYTAIMTDTGCFRFSNTDPETHRAIAELIQAGAEPSSIYDKVYNVRTFEQAKLLGDGFANMEIFYSGKLCIMTLNMEQFHKTNTSEDDIDNFVETVLTTKGVLVAVLIAELPDKNEIKISFRSKLGFNVRTLAQLFGGGGHNQAAGAKVEYGNILQIRQQIVEQAEMIFKD